ncbi:MAG: hypothetical protein V3V08_23770 [Nannocystaceae bacterium]
MPRFRRGAFLLFLLTFAGSLLLGDRPSVAPLLWLDVDVFLSGGGWWQPLTASFVYPSTGLAALVGTLLVQWFFASPVEGFWGTRRYLVMVMTSSVAGYLAVALVGLWLPEVRFVRLSGALPIDLAAITSFGVVFARQRYAPFGMSPVQGRVLAGFVASLLILLPLSAAAGVVSVLPGLVAAMVAALFAVQPWRGGKKSGTLGRPTRRSKQASHLKVVRTVDDLLN